MKELTVKQHVQEHSNVAGLGCPYLPAYRKPDPLATEVCNLVKRSSWEKLGSALVLDPIWIPTAGPTSLPI